MVTPPHKLQELSVNDVLSVLGLQKRVGTLEAAAAPTVAFAIGAVVGAGLVAWLLLPVKAPAVPA